MAHDVFAVLADPTRRRLLQALASGERSVNDLVRRVDIEQPGVSRHLRILQEAGFVTVRPDAQRRWYSLRREPFEALAEWMGGVVQEQAERLQRLANLVEGPHRPGPSGRRP